MNSLLIVGNVGGTNIGGSFLRGARRLGLDVHLVRMQAAMEAPSLVRRFNWWCRGRRPTWLKRFSQQVVQQVREMRPTWLLATGIAPLTKEALGEIGSLGVERLNFLTDDPWNAAHRAEWFLQALSQYDRVFSPRRSNISDLKRLGAKAADYLPFAFDEELFFPEGPATADENGHFQSEVVFAGGADDDRVPYFIALSEAGINVSLYGDYWSRWPELRRFARGHADPPKLRKAITGAKVSVCLVRRANRDGHSMRTFEVPAVGSCMLVEDTAEHRELFGEEGEAVAYFEGVGEMVGKVRWLLQHDAERERMAASATKIIVSGSHTYADRLKAMLGLEGVGG